MRALGTHDRTKPVHISPPKKKSTTWQIKVHVHTVTEKYENATIPNDFGFVFEENGAGKSNDYGDVIV